MNDSDGEHVFKQCNWFDIKWKGNVFVLFNLEMFGGGVVEAKLSQHMFVVLYTTRL